MTWEHNQSHSHPLLSVKDTFVPLQEKCTIEEWRFYSLQTVLLLYVANHDPHFVFTLLHVLILLEAGNMENENLFKLSVD